MRMAGSHPKLVAVDLYERLVRRSRVGSYLRDLNKSQWLKADQLRELQWISLKRVLEYANTFVPYYRDLFRGIGVQPGDIRNIKDFEKLPLLTRKTVQENGDRLTSLDPGCRLIPHHTGGSTGVHVHFCLGAESRDVRIASALRADGWSGWRRGEPVMHLWSINTFNKHVYGSTRARLRDWLENRRMVNFADHTFGQLADSINRYRPTLIVAYTNPLYQLAKWLESNAPLAHAPRAAIVSAETLHEFQRQTIQRALRCPVFNRYGCSEVGCIAAECDEHDGLHVMVDTVVTEIVPAEHVVDEAGGLGEVAVTDLYNFATPLIRYRIGDLARWKAPGNCRCGRGLPRLERVSGRIMDCLCSSDGRLIPGQHALRLFENYKEIGQFQLMQTARNRVQVRVVAHGESAPDLGANLERGLRQLLGEELIVALQFVDSIPAAPSGKFRYVVNQIPAEQQSSV